jgi:hypothetical protein
MVRRESLRRVLVVFVLMKQTSELVAFERSKAAFALRGGMLKQSALQGSQRKSAKSWQAVRIGRYLTNIEREHTILPQPAVFLLWLTE